MVQEEDDHGLTECMCAIRAKADTVGLPTELPENSRKNLPVLTMDSQVFHPLVEPLVLVAAYTKSLPFLNTFLDGDLSLRFLESASVLLNEAVMKTEEANSILNNPVLEVIEEDFDIYRHLNTPKALDTGFGASSKERDPIFMIGFCQLYLADILMHCSVASLSIKLLICPDAQRWLDIWEASNDHVFKLKAAKIRANLETHIYRRSTQRGNEGRPVVSTPVILGPNLYKLDNRRIDSPPPEADVIFINGMHGSVFYTWRKRVPKSSGSSRIHAEPSVCWPKEWLSKEFPNTRIIGVDANLRFFVWNEICFADQLMRSIDQRARIILRQLLVAGVGERPIIWVSHSAGGILNKEILRISATHFADWTKNTDPIVPLELSEEISIPFNSFAFCDNCESENQTASPAKVVHVLPEVAEVAKKSSLIIFLSVPHRGGVNLNHYYLYPMITKLTPEALDLRKDNPSIVSLHAWFTIWASQRPIRIVNMVETKKLRFSPLLPGMIIVPYDQRDEGYSEVVQIAADHETICKPETRADEVYVRIATLIRDQVTFT
ncbi:hypothetical protein AAHC03_05318 [Spirometra sp. Aus1]